MPSLTPPVSSLRSSLTPPAADAPAFTRDVFQVVRHKSYLPGARPPPPAASAPRPSQPPPRSHPTQSLPPTAPQHAHHPSNGPVTSSATAHASRKRNFDDHEDQDVEFILNGSSSYPDSRPAKQQKKGRNHSNSQRGGRGGRSGGNLRESPNAPHWPQAPSHSRPSPVTAGGGDGSFPPFPQYNQPRLQEGLPGMSPMQLGQMGQMPPIDAASIMENIQRLQQMGIPIPQLGGFPGQAQPQPRRKKRCRKFDKTGVCPRGASCKFSHGDEAVFLPNAYASAPSDGESCRFILHYMRCSTNDFAKSTTPPMPLCSSVTRVRVPICRCTPRWTCLASR